MNELSDSDLTAELKAIGDIRQILSPFDEGQRSRIIGYVQVSLGSSAAPALEPVTISTVSVSQADPRRYFADKRPSTDIEKVLILGSSITSSGEQRFDSNRLLEELRRAAVRQFNVIEAAKSAVKKGYFAPAGEGKRQLTVLGEEVANALPDRAAVDSILKDAGRRAAPARRR